MGRKKSEVGNKERPALGCAGGGGGIEAMCSRDLSVLPTGSPEKHAKGPPELAAKTSGDYEIST